MKKLIKITNLLKTAFLCHIEPQAYWLKVFLLVGLLALGFKQNVLADTVTDPDIWFNDANNCEAFEGSCDTTPTPSTCGKSTDGTTENPLTSGCTMNTITSATPDSTRTCASGAGNCYKCDAGNYWDTFSFSCKPRCSSAGGEYGCSSGTVSGATLNNTRACGVANEKCYTCNTNTTWNNTTKQCESTVTNYKCGTNKPVNATWCSDDANSVTQTDNDKTYPVSGIGACTSNRKCEYYNTCTGTVPTNTTLCSGDDVGVPAETIRTAVSNCTTGAKCEYVCNTGTKYVNGKCEPYSCTGTKQPDNTTLCAGDNTNLTTDTPMKAVATCSTDTTTKCEYKCKTGFVFDTNNQSCVLLEYKCKDTREKRPDGWQWCYNDTENLTSNTNAVNVGTYDKCNYDKKCEYFVPKPESEVEADGYELHQIAKKGYLYTDYANINEATKPTGNSITITGFIWSKNFGWIDLQPNKVQVNGEWVGGVTANYKATNSADQQYELSGLGWNDNIGWVNFDGVFIGTDGVWGNKETPAWNELLGNFVFNGKDSCPACTPDYETCMDEVEAGTKTEEMCDTAYNSCKMEKCGFIKEVRSVNTNPSTESKILCDNYKACSELSPINLVNNNRLVQQVWLYPDNPAEIKVGSSNAPSNIEVKQDPANNLLVCSYPSIITFENGAIKLSWSPNTLTKLRTCKYIVNNVETLSSFSFSFGEVCDNSSYSWINYGGDTKNVGACCSAGALVDYYGNCDYGGPGPVEDHTCVPSRILKGDTSLFDKYCESTVTGIRSCTPRSMVKCSGKYQYPAQNPNECICDGTTTGCVCEYDADNNPSTDTCGKTKCANGSCPTMNGPDGCPGSWPDGTVITDTKTTCLPTNVPSGLDKTRDYKPLTSNWDGSVIINQNNVCKPCGNYTVQSYKNNIPLTPENLSGDLLPSNVCAEPCQLDDSGNRIKRKTTAPYECEYVVKPIVIPPECNKIFFGNKSLSELTPAEFTYLSNEVPNKTGKDFMVYTSLPQQKFTAICEEPKAGCECLTPAEEASARSDAKLTHSGSYKCSTSTDGTLTTTMEYTVNAGETAPFRLKTKAGHLVECNVKTYIDCVGTTCADGGAPVFEDIKNEHDDQTGNLDGEDIPTIADQTNVSTCTYDNTTNTYNCGNNGKCALNSLTNKYNCVNQTILENCIYDSSKNSYDCKEDNQKCIYTYDTIKKLYFYHCVDQGCVRNAVSDIYHCNAGDKFTITVKDPGTTYEEENGKGTKSGLNTFKCINKQPGSSQEYNNTSKITDPMAKSSIVVEFPLSGIKEDRGIIECFATDKVGNENKKVYHYIYDNTAPRIVLPSSKLTGQANNIATKDFAKQDPIRTTSIEDIRKTDINDTFKNSVLTNRYDFLVQADDKRAGSDGNYVSQEASSGVVLGKIIFSKTGDVDIPAPGVQREEYDLWKAPTDITDTKLVGAPKKEKADYFNYATTLYNDARTPVNNEANPQSIFYIYTPYQGFQSMFVRVKDQAGNQSYATFFIKVDTRPIARYSHADWINVKTPPTDPNDRFKIILGEKLDANITTNYAKFNDVPANTNYVKNIYTGAMVRPTYFYTIKDTKGITLLNDSDLSQFNFGTDVKKVFAPLGPWDMQNVLAKAGLGDDNDDGKYFLELRYEDSVLQSHPAVGNNKMETAVSLYDLFIDNTNRNKLRVVYETPNTEGNLIVFANVAGTNLCNEDGIKARNEVNVINKDNRIYTDSNKNKIFFRCQPGVRFLGVKAGSGKTDTYTVYLKKRAYDKNTRLIKKDADDYDSASERPRPIIFSERDNYAVSFADTIKPQKILNNEKTYPQLVIEKAELEFAKTFANDILTPVINDGGLVNRILIDGNIKASIQNKEVTYPDRGILEIYNGSKLDIQGKVENNTKHAMSIYNIDKDSTTASESFNKNSEFESINQHTATKVEMENSHGGTDGYIKIGGLSVSSTSEKDTDGNIITLLSITKGPGFATVFNSAKKTTQSNLDAMEKSPNSGEGPITNDETEPVQDELNDTTPIIKSDAPDIVVPLKFTDPVTSEDIFKPGSTCSPEGRKEQYPVNEGEGKEYWVDVECKEQKGVLVWVQKDKCKNNKCIHDIPPKPNKGQGSGTNFGVICSLYPSLPGCQISVSASSSNTAGTGGTTSSGGTGGNTQGR